MNRIEVNVRTGEVKTIELTPTEVADAQARAAAELSLPKIKGPLEFLTDRVAALEAKLAP